jgi:hypothetical protein
MTLLKRGTIKSYDAGSHEATVGIAGSQGVWLAAVPVHMGVNPDDIVAGLECGVLFFTEDNPDDAVVVTVHGAVPTPIVAGVQTLIEDADQDTRVDAEEAADEDRLRFYTAGTQRLVMKNSSIHHEVIGTSFVSPGPLYVGDSTTSTGWLALRKAMGNITSAFLGFDINTSFNFNANNLTGEVMNAAPGATFNAGTSGGRVYGLNFIASAGGTGSAAELIASQVRLGLLSSGAHTLATMFNIVNPLSIGFSGSITDVRGIRVMNQGLAAFTNVYQIDVEAVTAGTNRFGVRVANISGGTIARMLELTNAMRVEGTGNWTPTANQTPVLIYEGTTPTIRRVQWMDPGAGGANFAGGERVMVLV